MKKITLLLFYSIIFILNIQSQSILKFAAGQNYYLSDDEKTANLDSDAMNIYLPFNSDLDTPIPLNKAVTSAKYRLFIGLALYNTPDDLNKYFIKNIPDNKIFKTDEIIISKVKIYKLFVFDNGFYNYKLIFKTKKTVYTAVLNYISSDSSVIADIYYDNFFIVNKLGKKIK